MQTEEIFDPELAVGKAGVRRRRPSGKTQLLIWIHAVTFLLGLGLLFYVVYKIGYDKILESLSTVGWGFLVVLALNLARHLGRAASLFLAIEPEHRQVSFSSVVAARFGGEAVNFFSFAGPFLGDAARAVLLKKDLPLTHGASAVIIDNILYYLSVILMILAGVAALAITLGSGSGMSNALVLIAAFSIAGLSAIILAIKHHVTPVSWVISFLARRQKAPGFLLKKQESILNVENNVFRFYHERRNDFFKVLAVSLSVHLLSVAEVYCVLMFLNFPAQVSTAFIIESLTKVINVAFSFVPGTIGVYEGGNGVITEILGMTAAAGVALALVRRGAILFSTALGLLVIIWRAAEKGARHLKGSGN